MSASPSKRRYVMLDRDGTIIADRHYLSDPDEIELLPEAIEGLQKLTLLGLGLVMITNQSGIGRGYFSQARLDEVHQRLKSLLAAHGVFFDGIYVCPHVPEDRCSCRKPLPGLVSSASAEFGFEPADGFVIGDQPCDIQLGRAISARTFLIRADTNYGAQPAAEAITPPDYTVSNILEAAAIIAQLPPQFS